MSKFERIYSGKRKFHALEARIDVNYVNVEYMIISIKYSIAKK